MIWSHLERLSNNFSPIRYWEAQITCIVVKLQVISEL
jgi:hypothetical protein